MGREDFYDGFKSIGETITPALKVWFNGMALKADTWKSCTNFCTYCFAREGQKSMIEAQKIKWSPKVARGMNVKHKKKSFFDKLGEGKNPYCEWAVMNNKYVELGTMGETFQEPDRKYGITYSFLDVLDKYEIPIFTNTKMNLLVKDETYFNKVADHSAPVLLSPTLTTVDDELSKKIEPNAPKPSDRLETIKRFKEAGVSSCVYTAPFIPTITDADLEEYVNKLLEAGVEALHLRNFYMCAKLHKNDFWSKYYQDNKDLFSGDRLKPEVMEDAVNKVKDLTKGEDLQVVGRKTRWFDMAPFVGKAPMDLHGEEYVEPLLDFTLIPILRKVRLNKQTPQLLDWNEIGHKRNKIDYPKAVKTQEMGGVQLLETTCTMGKRFQKRYEMEGYNFITNMSWDGVKANGVADGRISEVASIFRVTKNGECVEKDGHYLYAYIPKEKWDEYVNDEGTVPYSEARKFKVPQRKGGTGDKYWKPSELEKIY